MLVKFIGIFSLSFTIFKLINVQHCHNFQDKQK